MSNTRTIPVVDIFAGPGGLGEGFSRFSVGSGRRPYSVRLSIEKNSTAHRTLELRALFHLLSETRVPDAYYEHLRGFITRDELFSIASLRDFVGEARREAR